MATIEQVESVLISAGFPKSTLPHGFTEIQRGEADGYAANWVSGFRCFKNGNRLAVDYWGKRHDTREALYEKMEQYAAALTAAGLPVSAHPGCALSL